MTTPFTLPREVWMPATRRSTPRRHASSRSGVATLLGCIAVVATGCAQTNPAISPVAMSSWEHLSSEDGELPVPNGGTQQTGSLVLDVDGDGADEFVITERTQAPAMVLFRRTGSGWEKSVIDDAHLRIEAGGAAHDIDGDGDLDIVFGGDSQSNQLWWWENPHPNHTRDAAWKRHLIKDSGVNQHHDQIFADVKGTGQPQLIFWNQRAKTLFLAEIPDNPGSSGPWPLETIFSGEAGEGVEGAAAYAEGVDAADVDGDGRVDILAGNYWFKYLGNGQFQGTRIGTIGGRIKAAAFNPGRYPQVVIAPGDGSGPLRLYEASGDPTVESSWVGRDLLARDMVHGHTLEVGDVNGDGHLDIFAAEMAKWTREPIPADHPQATAWILLGNGAGQFEVTVLKTGHGWHEGRLGDFDGDGDLDVLNKPYTWDAPRVDLWLNQGAAPVARAVLPSHWQRQAIDPELPNRAMYVRAGDVDGDGNADLVAGGFWYRNPGVLSGPWERHTIGAPLNNLALVHDLDGDGDLDVLGTEGIGADANADFVWARNDGQGNFTILDNIPRADGDFLQGVVIDRLQPGGPLEVVLSWHQDDRGVQVLTVPEDPSTGTWGLRRISDRSQDEDLTLADIDRDGDLDLFQGTQWLENPGASTRTWATHVIGETTDGLPDRNDVFDFNGDGRLDAVVGLELGSDILLFLSPPDPRDPWERRIIASGVGGGFSMDAGDVDGDGDADIILGEHRGKPENRVLLFENVENASSWRTHVLDHGRPDEIDHHDGTQLVDLDGDGDLDLISLGWYNPKVWVYENLSLTSTR